jgi:ABC-type uncharacterized transport system ATPase subunit
MLARMMVGRDVLLDRRTRRLKLAPCGWRCAALVRSSVTGQAALRDVTLEVHAGEILGVAGVSGNGQRELADVVAGLRALSGGSVEMDGRNVSAWSPGKRTDAGLAYIPEERMHDGIVQEFSVAENLVLQDYDHAPNSKGIFLNFDAIAQRGRELVADFNIRTPSIETPTRSLSGGNIQKLILARELSRNPKVLVAAQPTRGVDIGATEYIHQRLLDQRAQGTAHPAHL